MLTLYPILPAVSPIIRVDVQGSLRRRRAVAGGGPTAQYDTDLASIERLLRPCRANCLIR